MGLVLPGGPALWRIGAAGRTDTPHLSPVALNSTAATAAKGCVIYVGQVWTSDGASHTIDATASSSIGFKTGSVTLANAASNLRVGLAAVDFANGPPARAINVTDAITFDVYRNYTNAGAPTANAWNEAVPTNGSKTIANADFVALCFQFTAWGGADSVAIASCTTGTTNAPAFPNATTYNGTTYSAAAGLVNAIITFADGAKGYFWGGVVFSTPTTTQTWNNGSASVEFGNYFKLPFNCQIAGLYGATQVSGNLDAVIYDTPFGTPSVGKTVSQDLNTVGASGLGRNWEALFATPYNYVANSDIAAIIKPTSATNVALTYTTMNAAAHMNAWPFGTNCYAVSRASGAFAAVNSSKDRFCLGLMIGAVNSPNNQLINSQGMIG